MVAELRRPTRRGNVEFPSGEDETSPRPQYAGDLRDSPQLVREKPEGINAHGRVNTCLRQTGRRGVSNQESGAPAQSKLSGSLLSLFHCHLREINTDQ